MMTAATPIPFSAPPVRILALGDCNTERGSAEASGPSIVEHVVHRLMSVGIVGEAVNFGLTMTTTREGLARVRQDRPFGDAVLLNYGLVDSWITTIPQIYVPYFPDSRPRRIARKALKFAKRRFRSPGLRRWIPTGHVVAIEEYEANLRAMIKELRTINPQIRVVLWATSYVVGSPGRNIEIDRYNIRLRSLAATANAEFLDTAAVLEPIPVELRYDDGLHLSGVSRQRLGVAIADLLQLQLHAATVGRPRQAA